MPSWVQYSPDHPFPIQNLPYGVAVRENVTTPPRCVTAIGDYVVDLYELAEAGFFQDCGATEALKQPTLNDFMGLGRSAWSAVRKCLTNQFTAGHEEGRLEKDEDLKKKVLIPKGEVRMKLPAKIGDYTDFYSSREHATNCGRLFRPEGDPLLPNWLHIPIGYHGRASSIVVSGTPVRRPLGQVRPPTAPLSDPPTFGPEKLLDMEIEVAAWMGPGNELGEPISIENARDHVFGLSLFNDWSARSIQKWEMAPLGPFLGKSFASTTSPWIVTMEALEPFTVPGPKQGEGGDPTPLPYLQQSYPGAFDIHLTATVTPAGQKEAATLSRTNFKYMYWSVFQQLTHHTVNGCNLSPGDVFASGTISGPDDKSMGSMLEITRKGAQPFQFPGGERKFFLDGDSVDIGGYCQGDGFRIGFGPCEGTILPAPEFKK